MTESGMTRFSLAIVTVLTMFGGAFAQDSKKPDKPQDNKPQPPGMSAESIVNAILERMDSNKDGKLSKSEARNRIADAFDQIDTDKDGYLSRKELLAVAQRF